MKVNYNPKMVEIRLFLGFISHKLNFSDAFFFIRCIFLQLLLFHFNHFTRTCNFLLFSKYGIARSLKWQQWIFHPKGKIISSQGAKRRGMKLFCLRGEKSIAVISAISQWYFNQSYYIISPIRGATEISYSVGNSCFLHSTL